MEYGELLRLQLDRDRAAFEKADMADHVQLVDERLAGLDAEIEEAAKAAPVVAAEPAPEVDLGTGTYEDRTLDQLRALVDERGVEADKRSRDSMIDALRGKD